MSIEIPAQALEICGSGNPEVSATVHGNQYAPGIFSIPKSDLAAALATTQGDTVFVSLPTPADFEEGLFGFASVEGTDRIVCDTQARGTYIDGVERSFTFSETNLLHLLARHAGKCLPDERIIERIHGDSDLSVDPFGALRVLVYRVRTKLGPELSRAIKREQRVGFRALKELPI